MLYDVVCLELKSESEESSQPSSYPAQPPHSARLLSPPSPTFLCKLTTNQSIIFRTPARLPSTRAAATTHIMLEP